MNTSAWSGEAVLSHPDTLAAIHRSFLDAGADVLIANTFSTALHNLQAAGIGDKFEAINHKAVTIVTDVIADSARPCIAASGISTSTFSGPLDYSRLPSGDEAVAYYARMADIHVQAGAQLIILEMMRDIEQTTHALHGALQAGVPVWIGFSCFAAEDGRIFLLDTDIPLERALAEVPLEESQGVGIMHTLVEHTPASVAVLKEAWDGFSFAYPHAGHFIMPNWIFKDAMTPDGFAEVGQSLYDSGIDAVGGCCGITPAHIAALRDKT